MQLILLAGGKSSRMGQPKGLMKISKDFWLLDQLASFHNSGGKRVTLVLGYDAEKYFQSFPWLENAKEKWIQKDGLGISVIKNSTPELGPFSSLICAWKFLKKENPSPVFLLPIDVPCPDKNVFDALNSEISKKSLVCVPTLNNKGGHPVLLSKDFLDRLLEIAPEGPDARLDRQISRLPDNQIKRVPVIDKKILMNLNSPTCLHEKDGRHF